jgi:hypothetical protein
MLSAKDLITENNVVETYTQGKYVIFVLNNGMRVKIDPNQSGLGNSAVKLNKEEK